MKKNILILLLAVFGLASCSEDYLETAPSSSIGEADVFASINGTQTVIEGMHRYMYAFAGAHSRFGQKSVDYTLDVLGEDFFPNERGYGWFVNQYQYLTHRNIQNADLEYIWAFYYDLVANANMILSNIDEVPTASTEEAQRDNIKAQALSYRAFAHYQLVQLFADRYKYEAPGTNSHLGVPIVLNPGPDGLPRNTVEEVYTQIKKDLTDALVLFNGKGKNFDRGSDVSQINLNVAEAIFARVSLTIGDWAGAVTHARNARAGRTLVEDYTYGWNKANTEWIWGALLIDEQQTSYASFFSHIDPLFGGYATLGNHKLASKAILDFMNDSDQRKMVFNSHAFGESIFKSRFRNKENVGWKYTGLGEWTNDYLYIKAGEMYLIEAEALARQGGQDAVAIDVLTSLVKNRDPEYVAPALTGESLINHILMQRRCELWGDGQRFLDIKRINKGMDRRGLGHNESLWDAASHYPAGAKEFLFLIPKQEMESNPNMEQNPL